LGQEPVGGELFSVTRDRRSNRVHERAGRKGTEDQRTVTDKQGGEGGLPDKPPEKRAGSEFLKKEKEMGRREKVNLDRRFDRLSGSGR